MTRMTEDPEFINYFIQLPNIIHYSNDEEYRQAVRKAFRFNPHESYTYDGLIQDPSKLDDITKDELCLDVESMEFGMSALYEATISELYFKKLYIKAAGRMFSTDPKIGQAVLCSYDTFIWYYGCMWHYLRAGNSGLKQCIEYKKLNACFA